MAAYDLPLQQLTSISPSANANAGSQLADFMANIEQAKQLQWNRGSEGRRRALNAERAETTKSLFDQGLASQRENFDTDAAFLKAVEDNKIFTADNNIRLVNENGVITGGFRDRNERETPEQYLAAQQAWKAGNPQSIDQLVVDAKNTLVDKIFSDPANWADPAKLEKRMRAGLKQKGFSEENINAEIDGLLNQHYQTLDPTIAAEQIKSLREKKTTTERYADQLFPKQFAPSGKNSAGENVNHLGMTSKEFAEYNRDTGKYVKEWTEDQKLKGGTRRFWRNGWDFGRKDTFEDSIPVFLEKMKSVNIGAAEALQILESDMQNNTTAYDIRNLTEPQLEAFRARSQNPLANPAYAGQADGSGAGGSGFMGVDTNELLSRDAKERAEFERLIQETIAQTQRRARFAPDELAGAFNDQSLLSQAGLTLGGQQPDRALMGIDRVSPEDMAYANTVPVQTAPIASDNTVVPPPPPEVVNTNQAVSVDAPLLSNQQTSRPQPTVIPEEQKPIFFEEAAKGNFENVPVEMMQELDYITQLKFKAYLASKAKEEGTKSGNGQTGLLDALYAVQAEAQDKALKQQAKNPNSLFKLY